MAKLFDIQNIPENLLPQVGGKARGLYQLIQFGFNVPKAFVIVDADESYDFESAALKYEEDGYETVSVRSSATMEDGRDFSAAGQFSTFLNVKGKDELIKAARSCRESLHNYTAQQYSRNFLKCSESKMNIIVQKMISPRCAGVIFSKAPMRGGFTLVEAVPGLGENLVSGKMSAQQYRVRGSSIEEMPENSILTREEAIALGKAGRKAEQLFGMPMDLEWAIDQDGTVHWLQARPITVGESVTMNELDCANGVCNDFFTTANIGEVMPGAVTPLNLSTNMYALDWGVMQTYLEIGCISSPAKPFSYIAPFYNHMFFNMSNMYQICHAAYGSNKDSLEVQICGAPLEGAKDIDMKVPQWRRIRNCIPFFKIVFGGDTVKQGMDKVISSIKFDLDKDARSIYNQILANFDGLKWAQYYHYRASYYSGGQSAMLDACEKDFASKEEFKSLVAGCLTQIEDFESANILRMMKALAAKILAVNPEAGKLDVAALQQYVENEAPKEVKGAYDDFMARHGHRGLREPEIMSHPWREDRKSFFTSLRSVLNSSDNEPREEKPWTDYADIILSRYKGFKRKMVAGFIEKARKGVCYREYTKSRTIYALDLFRGAYRRLAKLMVEEGMLPDRDLIFFLLQDEVGKVLDGDSSYVKKAMARRRLFPQQQALKFPFGSTGIPQPLPVAASGPDVAVIKATAVSRGIATGPARVVRNEEDASQLKAGEIMIAESTDIGWSPYYSIIAGLVTEIGSALSHGVVVAREYALPTVVNALGAMDTIHTGDNVTLDANSGKVLINKRV